MMDFYTISVKENRSNNRSTDFTIFPTFMLDSKDLVCKGGSMYAFWNGKEWNHSRADLRAIIDREIQQKKVEVEDNNPGKTVACLLMSRFDSKQWQEFAKYEGLMDQSDILFNQKLLFSNDEMKREDYSTNQLTYTPTEGETPYFDELTSVLYSEEELSKIMWFIGALLTNNMRKIQKFLYLYGGKGTGKGTIIKIIKMLFEGYYASIDLDLLTNGGEFATGQVKEVPLLIDEDSDISRIKKDTNLLKLTSHEPLSINKKYQSPYEVVFNGLLVAASNERFKVKHVDSGIVRRAIVAEPTNDTHDGATYNRLMKQIPYELPYIAWKAIQLFEECGPYYYDKYMAVSMMEDTDYMFAFMREYYEQLGDTVTLKSAGELYKQYLDELGFETNGYKRVLKMGLKHYYREFSQSKRIDGVKVRNVFTGLKRDTVFPDAVVEDVAAEVGETWIKLGPQPNNKSIFDEVAQDYPAQLANQDGFPSLKWELVKTTLKDLDSSQLHFVRVPTNHIVIDFDLKDGSGEKSLALNVAAASDFPPTYCEVSKSGKGIHLHYMYDEDITKLSSLFDDNIEIKVFKGKASLRRKLTLSNSLPITHISTGLPLKEENKQMYESVEDFVWTEKKMRAAIIRNLRKEIHANTKPSIDFIKKIFEDAKAAGVKYDLRDMRSDILSFAASSTNQSKYTIGVVANLPYTTVEDEVPELPPKPENRNHIIPKEDLYFYDVESFPNVFIVVYKKYDGEPVRLINPTKAQIEAVLQKPLVGFNNRKYDNHMMYGALMGETPYQLFQRSQKLINNSMGGTHASAYNMSYADIYEFSTKKQGLKKWEAELGILHDELEFDWSAPVPEEMWDRVAEYCQHDVEATQVVFDHLEADYVARLILAEVSGLPVNAKTQDHTAKIIFGDDKRPQDKFVYTDLSEEFPGYKFEYGKSSYRGEDPGEGGYVYSEPGIYENVGLLDIGSMHPHSLKALNYFGEYTQNFVELVEARMYVKHRELDKAAKVLNGALRPFLNGDYDLDALAYALKIAINIVYGMTSAKYENKFREKLNVDNIVAKRGALFMIDLKHAVQEKGYTVVHIKTDSIKIANVDQEIIDFVMDYGKNYGYTFELEHTYKKMALVNKAVYIAQLEDGSWEPTGAEFAQPYVYKKLFSHEEVTEKDFEIIKSATAPIYLGEHHVGKVAPVYASITGEQMWRVDKEKDKKGFITGTKGFLWRLTSDYQGKKDIDMSYYDGLVKQALLDIDKHGSVEKFIEVPDEYLEYLLPF